jgi:hypothetical protein
MNRYDSTSLLHLGGSESMGCPSAVVSCRGRDRAKLSMCIYGIKLFYNLFLDVYLSFRTAPGVRLICLLLSLAGNPAFAP